MKKVPFLFVQWTLTPLASYIEIWLCSCQYSHTFFTRLSWSVWSLKKIKHLSILPSLSFSSSTHQREILGMYQIALDFEVDPVVQLGFSLTILSNWYLLWVQQGLEIRCFWFQKKTVQLKTVLHEVYTYVLNEIFFQKTVYLQGFCSKSVLCEVTPLY